MIRLDRKAAILLTGVMLALGSALSAAAEVTRITLKANDTGREFEGWGTLSAGATSVFLRDYPEPYRSDILDYLFKPKYGLSIQHLKVEIGSGVDSTCGSEPSHVITPDELKNPVPRGYELWLAAEARKRNPNIILEALPWGTPYWTKDYTTKEAAEWVIAFLDVAKKYYNLDFQYIGGSQNELEAMRRNNPEGLFGPPFDFVKKYLRPMLDANGYQKVQIQMADHYNPRHEGKYKWGATRKIMGDPELNAIVPVIGYHYPVGYGKRSADDRPMPEGFLESGKRHWASEDYSVTGGAFASAHEYMRKIVREYDELRMVKSVAWAPFTSMPKGFVWSDVGFLDASDCWSGHYELWPAMWCMAHLTQFAEPGWTYMDAAVKSSGKDLTGAMFMALKAPNGKDWSLIAVAGTKPAPFAVQIDPAMACETVHVWKSDAKDQMVELKSIKPANGEFSMTLEPATIYTLTSTTGQTKGTPAHPIPPAVPGGPWKDDLTNYKVHDKVKYWGDYEGTFEIAQEEGRNVMKQMVPKPGCLWHKGTHGACIAIYGGCDAASQFAIQAETKIADGYVMLGGDILGGRTVEKAAVALKLSKTGEWGFIPGKLSGKIQNFDPAAWHSMEVRLFNGVATGRIDGQQLFETAVTNKAPMTIAITSSYNPNMFRNIEVQPGTPGSQSKASAEPVQEEP